MKMTGNCPVLGAIGEPGSGKSKAAMASIALTGSYPRFYSTRVTTKASNELSVLTTQGICLDDANDGKEVGEVSKRFFDGGETGQATKLANPESCAIFTFNQHILEWLQKKQNSRLVSL